MDTMRKLYSLRRKCAPSTGRSTRSTEHWEVGSSVLGKVSWEQNRKEMGEESKSLKIGVRKSLLEKCPTQLETVTLLT